MRINLFPSLALGLLLAACRPAPPPTSPTTTTEPTMTTPPPAAPAIPSATVTRFHIGEPLHTYPLQQTPPLATPPAEPHIAFAREPGGSVMLTLPLAPDEAIWGFGQRFDAFNLRGVKLECWTTDGWNASDTSYHAVPFFISSRGYGLFVNHPGRVAFDLGASAPGVLSVRLPDDAVEVIAFTGTPADIARSYTELVGRPRPVPDWIYRPWISRNSYLGAYEIDRVVDRMAALGLPVGVAVLEAWAEQLHNFRFTTHRYPDPADWIRRLNAKGVQVVCWITSSVWTSSEAYRQARDRGFLVLNDDGSEHVVRWLENGRKIDFRKPEARVWWRDLQKPLIELGVAGIKTDGGEHMPDPSFHNLHAFYYQQASLDAFRDLGRSGITFARSASAPNAGLSTFWAGDQHAEWRGLRMAVRGGLSAALSGFPFWGHDIGGYSGTPTKELYIRWMQFGAFSPIMQFHGIGAREPWHYDEETLDIARFYFRVREQLLPRLAAWGEQARTDGTPIIRPLIWTDPGDTAVHGIDNQYLLGPDLLVAPITDPVPARGVYLPRGAWIDLWSGDRHEGPTNLLVRASLTRIPVFVRAAAYPTYRDLFAGAPQPDAAPVRVALAGPVNDRGLVPRLRYQGASREPEMVYYEVRNDGATTATMSVRLRAPAACVVEPSDRLNLMLAPGDVQRLAYQVAPRDPGRPASHTVALEVEHDGVLLPSPSVTVVVSPAWRVLGLFDGGVGSEQPLDRQPSAATGPWKGKHGRELTWTEVPAARIEPDGAIDLAPLIGGDGSSTYYLATELVSDRARDITVHAGFGDAMTVWVNGHLAGQVIGHRNAERDEDRFTVPLQSGTNKILIRNSRDLAPPRFYFRIDG